MPHSSQDFKNNVFINCPFDDQYRPLFDAVIFTIQLLALGLEVPWKLVTPQRTVYRRLSI